MYPSFVLTQSTVINAVAAVATAVAGNTRPCLLPRSLRNYHPRRFNILKETAS